MTTDRSDAVTLTPATDDVALSAELEVRSAISGSRPAHDSRQITPMTKVRLCLVTFGVIVGIVGALHGSAELLQGSTLVESRSVEALPEGWPNSEFNSMTRGSPVFSLLTEIPFYALGILAISVSTTLIVCSLTLMKNRGMIFASLLFAVLSVGIFMFGAGRGTPVAVSLPVVIAGVLSAVRTETRERTELERRRILSAFHSFYWLHIASWILFFPGLFIFSFYAEIPTSVFLVAFVSMPIGTLGALIFGYQYDKTSLVAG